MNILSFINLMALIIGVFGSTAAIREMFVRARKAADANFNDIRQAKPNSNQSTGRKKDYIPV